MPFHNAQVTVAKSATYEFTNMGEKLQRSEWKIMIERIVSVRMTWTFQQNFRFWLYSWNLNPADGCNFNAKRLIYPFLTGSFHIWTTAQGWRGSNFHIWIKSSGKKYQLVWAKTIINYNLLKIGPWYWCWHSVFVKKFPLFYVNT